MIIAGYCPSLEKYLVFDEYIDYARLWLEAEEVCLILTKNIIDGRGRVIAKFLKELEDIPYALGPIERKLYEYGFVISDNNIIPKPSN